MRNQHLSVASCSFFVYEAIFWSATQNVLLNDNRRGTNANTFRANTGVRACSSEQERTQIFRKILNKNSEYSWNIKQKRTRTRIVKIPNTNKCEHDLLVTVMLVTSLCWWLNDGDWFQICFVICEQEQIRIHFFWKRRTRTNKLFETANINARLLHTWWHHMYFVKNKSAKTSIRFPNQQIAENNDFWFDFNSNRLIL